MASRSGADGKTPDLCFEAPAACFIGRIRFPTRKNRGICPEKWKNRVFSGKCAIDNFGFAFYLSHLTGYFVSSQLAFVEGKSMAENKAPTKAATKTEIFQALADGTGLTRKQIAAVFDELAKLIKRDVGKKGPGVFVFPGLLKVKRVHKPATKERQGRNPATGEPMTIAAKKARTVVKALPLKSLKELYPK
jgi:nucleoid DNA-binding protein